MSPLLPGNGEPPAPTWKKVFRVHFNQILKLRDLHDLRTVRRRVLDGYTADRDGMKTTSG